MCPGAYTKVFPLHLFWVVLTAFYEHILSHFVISYSIIRYVRYSIPIYQCVYLFYDMCPVIRYSLFIMTLHIFLYYYIPILWLGHLCSSLYLHKTSSLNYTPVGHG